MRHLIVSRELPPAPYPAGGIGTYVMNIARLLAGAGDVVHVIGQQWAGAPVARQELQDGRLIIHRVPIDAPIEVGGRRSTRGEIELLHASALPAQAFGWNAAILAEALVETENIDAIEAQEWEAPLYFFLLRRTLGLGPARTPPCIVHLHSPSEFIWLHNEWSYGRPEFLPVKRQEEYCIAAADALICPSRYLARQAESHYRLAAGAVRVVPYPVGDFPAAIRDDRSYGSGPVAYAGRLEPRKGLIEFIEAAIAVAQDTPDVVFEFAGTDVMYRDGTSVGQYVRARIPGKLRPRFVFHGALSRSELAARLARARFAVVPSRWENFPNTCIEAMHAALPVLASPDGGMAEMVQDGRTGWIAASQRPADLEIALRRALGMTAEERATMGRKAATSIRERCNDGRVTEAHQRWRRSVAEAGAHGSLELPAILPWAGSPMHGEHRRAVKSIQHAVQGTSIASLVFASSAGSIAAALQSKPDAGVVIVARAGYERNLRFADRAREILARLPEVAIVSGWVAGDEDPATCAAFPYQWMHDGVGPVAAIRCAALVGPLDAGLANIPEPFAMWGLVNDVLAAGWKAVSAPMIAGTRTAAANGALPTGQTPRDRELRRYLRARQPVLVARDANALISLIEGGAYQDGQGGKHPRGDRWTGLTASQIAGLSVGGKLALAAGAARDPQRTIAWLRDQWSARRAGRTGIR